MRFMRAQRTKFLGKLHTGDAQQIVLPLISKPEEHTVDKMAYQKLREKALNANLTEDEIANLVVDNIIG